MIFVLDTETHRVQPGVALPRAVSVCFQREGGTPVLTLAKDAVEEVRRALLGDDIIVGHNIAFDMGVLCRVDGSLLPLVFNAYAKNRITDTMLREKLILLRDGLLGDGKGARGRFHKVSLSESVKRRLGYEMAGKVTSAGEDSHEDEDPWRLRYGELDGVPVDQWPGEAVRYAKDDVTWTLALYKAQREIHVEQTGSDYIPDEYAQARADWWLKLMGARGVLTDPDMVRIFGDELRAEGERLRKVLVAGGYMVEKAAKRKGTISYHRSMEAIRDLVKRAYGGTPPITPTGRVSTKREHLAEATHTDLLSDEDQDCLDALQEWTWIEKQSGTYLTAFERGVVVPMQPFWDVLLATGRTSCSGPNLQNPPRKGRSRECIVPRRGYVFLQADYSFIELCTLAQVCYDLFGWSKLRDAINDGLDPHLDFAAYTLGISYEEASRRRKAGDKDIEEKRQMAKAANFGLPGGLGAAKWRAYARQSYGVMLTEEDARQAVATWRKKWPDAVKFLQYIGFLSERSSNGYFQVEQPRTHRVRGRCTYTSGANTHFQGLAADGAKLAGFLIAADCMLNEQSPLYGSATVVFAHDEFILETPLRADGYNEQAARLKELMIRGMATVVPDVKLAAEATVMERWYKGAKPVFEDGRLVPWRPKE